MLLLIESIILCLIFALIILPGQYRNPLSQFASYPTPIKNRVYELDRYKEFINKTEQNNWKRKIIGTILIIIFFAVIAYYSGNRTFSSAYLHIFVLFMAINLCDLVIFDLFIFCHSKKLRIPGTEDMDGEYRDPWHHVKGAFKGTIIAIIAALLAASLVYPATHFF